MSAPAVLEELTCARQQLDTASALLLRPSPEALDRSSALLEATGCRLRELQPLLSQQTGNAVVLEEARRLRRSFQRTARLLGSAADFHCRWLQVRGALSGGYTKSGESAPLVHRNRICLHG